MRDGLLGRPVSDYDAATDALPEEVMRLFKRVLPTGIKHGTVTVLWKGRSIETTTFRREIGYADARRPDRVELGASLEEDLARRDFTINAMAYDPITHRLEDPMGGREDLKKSLVRAVGDPAERFGEDGLRPLRALRFAAQLGFEIEPATLAAIPGTLDRFLLVSAERIRDEFSKILLSPRPSRGLELMEKTGMLGAVLPELSAARGVEQKGFHRFDVLDHLFLATDATPPDIVLRLSALFHDAGKPETKLVGTDGIASFHRHEELSGTMAEAALKRLKFPNATIDAVAHLVRQHMFFYDETWTDAAVRRFVARVGEDSIEPLFALRLADGTAMTGIPVDPRSLEPFRRRIEVVLAQSRALGVKDLAIGGEDLAGLGIPRGPEMGKMLFALLETVLDDPGQNTKEQLCVIAKRMWKRSGG